MDGIPTLLAALSALVEQGSLQAPLPGAEHEGPRADPQLLQAEEAMHPRLAQPARHPGACFICLNSAVIAFPIALFFGSTDSTFTF